MALALARWARAGEGDAGLGLVAAALGFVVLGKPSGYFLLLTTAAWIAASALGGRTGARALGRALGVGLAIAGPVLAWNAARNDGDVLGLARYASWLASLRHPFTPGTELPNAPWLFVEWLSFSSFGVFRNLTSISQHRSTRRRSRVFLVGLAAALRGWRDATSPARRGVAWLAASAALNLGLVAYNCWFVGFSPQGRYVLLMVVIATAIACAAPAAAARSGFWRIWPALYGAFLAFAALWSMALIYANPCIAAR